MIMDARSLTMVANICAQAPDEPPTEQRTTWLERLCALQQELRAAKQGRRWGWLGAPEPMDIRSDLPWGAVMGGHHALLKALPSGACAGAPQMMMRTKEEVNLLEGWNGECHPKEEEQPTETTSKEREASAKDLGNHHQGLPDDESTSAGTEEDEPAAEQSPTAAPAAGLATAAPPPPEQRPTKCCHVAVLACVAMAAAESAGSGLAVTCRLARRVCEHKKFMARVAAPQQIRSREEVPSPLANPPVLFFLDPESGGCRLLDELCCYPQPQAPSALPRAPPALPERADWRLAAASALSSVELELEGLVEDVVPLFAMLLQTSMHG